MILEVPESGSKATVDSEKCSLRALLTELEDEGSIDATVNGHELRRPSPNDSGTGHGPNMWMETMETLFGISLDCFDVRMT